MMQAKLDVDLALIQQKKAPVVTESKGAIPSSRAAAPSAELVSSDR